VAEFKDRFASAGAEFRVALSGPLVSIGLGVLFVAIALADLASAVDGAAAWLGYINLILAAFNLLPASPLDGGRVLHAALWRAKGDYAGRRALRRRSDRLRLSRHRTRPRDVHLPGLVQRRLAAFSGWYLLQGAKAEARYVARRRRRRR
jgi:membrane-associated protease RseP (regulator of RpoE activity)